MKTVRVRICVVVDDEGSWVSSGWKGGGTVKDGVLIDAAMEMEITGPNTRVYFIEADCASRFNGTYSQSVRLQETIMSDEPSLKLTIEPLTKERMKALLKAALDAVTPDGGYEPAEDSIDGAQIVNGEWWNPEYGCDSLETTLSAIQNRLAFAIGVWYGDSLRTTQAGKQ